VASIPTTRADLARYIDHTLLKPSQLRRRSTSSARKRASGFLRSMCEPRLGAALRGVARGSPTCVVSVAVPAGATPRGRQGTRGPPGR